MKKTILLSMVALVSTVAYAQESRQDVSVSGIGYVAPNVVGNGVYLYPSTTGGFLLSYRYLLTPHSGLELNYSLAQNNNTYIYAGTIHNAIRTRNQEFTAAYVYGLSFKRYNPFVEGGVGGVFFTPIQEGSTTLDAKQGTSIGGLFGGGVAYEISPSFDIRLQYRGMILKAPSFGLTRLSTSRYEVVSTPAIGIAYHF